MFEPYFHGTIAEIVSYSIAVVLASAAVYMYWQGDRAYKQRREQQKTE